MRLALWTPFPDEAWVAAVLPLLRREVEVVVVAGADAPCPAADLHLYHVADDPAHVFVHRALRVRPGLVLLADWGLSRLALASSAGDWSAYVAEARRAHGERGSFVARQVARGLGGELLATFLTLNDRVLEASLGVIAFTEYVRARTAARLPGRPVVHVPLDFVGREERLPSREAAREALRLAQDATVVVTLSAGSATVLDRARRGEHVYLRPRPERGDEVPSLLAAADLALSLEYPPRGSLPPLLARALLAGLPVLVSAGSAADAEIEDGVVVKVSPGNKEPEELAALVDLLIGDPELRRRVGALARDHAHARSDPAPAAAALLGLARDVVRTSPHASPANPGQEEESTVVAWALEEVRGEGRDLGLVGPALGLEPLIRPLFGRRR